MNKHQQEKNNQNDPETPKVKYVGALPNLINSDDYKDNKAINKVKIQIRLSGDTLEIIGDSQIPYLVDDLFKAEDAKEMEMVLCG